MTPHLLPLVGIGSNDLTQGISTGKLQGENAGVCGLAIPGTGDMAFEASCRQRSSNASTIRALLPMPGQLEALCKALVTSASTESSVSSSWLDTAGVAARQRESKDVGGGALQSV